jgi:sugar phosphate isomerase/epimerase
MAADLQNFDRLAIHTQTNKPWTLAECIEHYPAAGVPAISVWRHVLEPAGPEETGRMLRESGLQVPALVRGGFFPSSEETRRRAAIDDNLAAIDEAAAIGAKMVVLVVGAEPGLALEDARWQVSDGIAACLGHAENCDVKLAIEPLHPMYAADKSCVNRMAEAREICDRLDHPLVGIAVDVYHVWWDPDLEDEIRSAGERERLFAFHICDWRVETRHMLTDRGLMGDGCIDIRRIRGWMEEAGFDGYNEVEIFSEQYWAMEQAEYLDMIKNAYLNNS